MSNVETLNVGQADELENLGSKKTVYKDTYDPSVLETFENRNPERDYVVTFDCTEGSSLCLTGDTLIDIARDESVNPYGIAIKDLVGTEGYVFGVNDTTGEPLARRYYNVRKTKELAPVVKITMEHFSVSSNRKWVASYIRCTPDHMILVRTHLNSFAWVKAKDLKPGMHLVCSSRVNDTIRDEPTHRLIAAAIFGDSAINGTVVHHIDGNHYNNSPYNLELKTPSSHISEHRKAQYGYESKLDIEYLVDRYNSGASILDLAKEFSCDFGTIKDRLSGLVEFRSQGESLRLKNKQVNEQRDIEICELYQRGYTSYEIGDYFDLHETRVLDILRENNIRIRGTNDLRAWRKQNYLPPLNHKVVSVEYDGLEDVYNMEVEDIHNFFANDIIVHNCPKTHQPDFFKLVISYIPDKKMVESKSLKLYIFSFRSTGAFHESIVNTVKNDLVKLMEPKYLEIRGIFSVRGGIAIYPFATYVSESYPEYKELERSRQLDVLRDASNRTIRYDM